MPENRTATGKNLKGSTCLMPSELDVTKFYSIIQYLTTAGQNYVLQQNFNIGFGSPATGAFYRFTPNDRSISNVGI